MSRKNTFLPLIQYRNQRKMQVLKNTVQIEQPNQQSPSIGNYDSIFDDDSFKFSKLMEKKDQEASNMVRKYLQKFQINKRKKKRNENDLLKDRHIMDPIQISKSFQVKAKSKRKLINISTLSKSIAVSPLTSEKTVQFGKPAKKKIRQLKTEQQGYKKLNTNKFPIRILDDVYKSKQQLFLRHGVIKTEVSKILQQGLKIQICNRDVPQKIYLQRLKKKPESESNLHSYQFSSRYQSEIDEENKNFYLRNIREMKSLELVKKFKIKVAQKKPSEKVSGNIDRFEKKILKQSYDEFTPWVDDKFSVELGDTLR